MGPIIFHILLAMLFFILIMNPFDVITRIYLKASELRLKCISRRAKR